VPRLNRVRIAAVVRQLCQPGRGDRGGVTVIVAVLFAAGVLLGMAALSVDVGQLLAEREELVSAADGAAQTIAVECAKTPARCATTAALDDVRSDAATIANANGNDGRNDVTLVCGRGGALVACDPGDAPTNLTACLPGQAPAGVDYVEVRTATRTATSTVLPTAFAGSFVPGYSGGRVAACSRVEWGAPGGGLSLTISICEWNAATANGTSFAPYPPNPPASAEEIIYLHGPGAATCNTSPPAGWDAPGGFGWLDPDPGADCYTTIAAGGDYPGNTGSSPSGDCKDTIIAAQQSREVQLIPVYDLVKGTGSNVTYHLAGVAAFVVTGYYLPGPNGKTADSWLTGNSPCNGTDRCVYGFFTQALLDSGTVSSGPNLGATIIRTIG
jgi:Flp pilus assembly protein TadG